MNWIHFDMLRGCLPCAVMREIKGMEEILLWWILASTSSLPREPRRSPMMRLISDNKALARLPGCGVRPLFEVRGGLISCRALCSCMRFE